MQSKSIETQTKDNIPLLSHSESPLPKTEPNVGEILCMGFEFLLGDNYPLSNLVLPLLLSCINSTPEHIAANGVITTMLNVALSSPLSLLYPMKQKVAPLASALEKEAIGSAEYLRIRQEIQRTYYNGLVISAIGTVIVIPILTHSGTLLKDRFHQSPAIAAEVDKFLSSYAWFIPLIFLHTCSSQILAGYKDTQALSMIPLASAIGLPVATLLVLYTKLKVDGVLIGYGLNFTIVSAISGYYVLFGPKVGFLKPLSVCHQKFEFMAYFPQDWREFQLNFQQFWPPFMEQLTDGLWLNLSLSSETILLFGLSILAGILSLLAQNAFSLIESYLIINTMLSVNFSVAGSISVCGMIGQDQSKEKIRSQSLNSILVSGVICTPIPLILASQPQWLMAIFHRDDPQLEPKLRYSTRIASAGSVFECVAIALLMQLRSFKDLPRAALIRASFSLTGLLMSSLLMDLDIAGVMTGYLMAQMFSVIACGICWFSLTKEYENKQKFDQKEVWSLSKYIRNTFFGTRHQPNTAGWNLSFSPSK